jgi:NADH dehydrogenase/NADH:ubiquinone oxidoreductase subunit G
MQVDINGKTYAFRAGLTVLEALVEKGMAIPALCHDPRVAPLNACRLCQVRINGEAHLHTACSTLLVDGMRIESHAPDIESVREGIFKMLARSLPEIIPQHTPLDQALPCEIRYGTTDFGIQG